MSKIIKFSYPFSKLYTTTLTPTGLKRGLTELATLLQVVRIDLSDLSQEMRDYDTDYERYHLPKKGAYLMLIFKHVRDGGLFTTLRRETPPKLEYYQRSVGETFVVEIENKLPPLF